MITTEMRKKEKNLTTNNTYLADDTAIWHVFLNKPVFARGHDLGKVADSKHFQTLSAENKDTHRNLAMQSAVYLNVQ